MQLTIPEPFASAAGECFRRFWAFWAFRVFWGLVGLRTGIYTGRVYLGTALFLKQTAGQAGELPTQL